MIQNDSNDEVFGVIYGTVTVMGILMVMETQSLVPLKTAAYLFISVLAIALAKAFAEICEIMLKQAQPATQVMALSAWQHSRSILIAANLPALSFIIAAFGLYSAKTALVLAQIAAILVLMIYGAKIGWAIRKTWLAATISGAITGSLGLMLALLKNSIH